VVGGRQHGWLIPWRRSILGFGDRKKKALFFEKEAKTFIHVN
jgi:hypothetical protein